MRHARCTHLRRVPFMLSGMMLMMFSSSILPSCLVLVYVPSLYLYHMRLSSLSPYQNSWTSFLGPPPPNSPFF